MQKYANRKKSKHEIAFKKKKTLELSKDLKWNTLEEVLVTPAEVITKKKR